MLCAPLCYLVLDGVESNAGYMNVTFSNKVIFYDLCTGRTIYQSGVYLCLLMWKIFNSLSSGWVLKR